MTKISDYFGTRVFNDKVMKEYLSEEVYATLKRTIDQSEQLDLSVANAVAEAMKDWAIQQGATHFTHWFQPLTGITAEKHDSFANPAPNGSVIMEFSGKELIKGEPDASSFPSGGLRATFEARGYTAWDPTSYAFIKGRTLCIPTAFCSYTGEALDKKTPLLRSMEAINKSVLRILRLFGNTDVKTVKTSVGPEQEYFLVDEDVFLKRPDLVFTGRTLFGAVPPKGQQLDDHYFGAIKPRVAEFMNEVNEELWKLGVYAKTEHNEVAPAQHELAVVYETTNIATDHNQLVMEVMKRVANKHHLVCLLQEKPFEGVNGSGKHNNWSIATDTGVNLLSPGDTPYENAQFLLFLVAVIEAVDTYQDLLRISVASAGNDHRLGANEAPPAIVSMFLGDELTAVLEAIETGKSYAGKKNHTMKLGVDVLPKFAKDTTDRNRTSPFAFTGNKFEFRMVGSNDSIACCNIMLNASVSEVLDKYAERLENAKDFNKELHSLLVETIKNHKRIIFNGNGYDDAWVKEATEVRGLSNYPTTVDCLPHLLDEKNVTMLQNQKVYSYVEAKARVDINIENYCKTVSIEGNTASDMVRRDILPAISEYTNSLVDKIYKKNELGLSSKYDLQTASKLSELTESIYDKVNELDQLREKVAGVKIGLQQAELIRDELIPLMNSIRKDVDLAETMVARDYWPYPTYADLLFSVK